MSQTNHGHLKVILHFLFRAHAISADDVPLATWRPAGCSESSQAQSPVQRSAPALLATRCPSSHSALFCWRLGARPPHCWVSSSVFSPLLSALALLDARCPSSCSAPSLFFGFFLSTWGLPGVLLATQRYPGYSVPSWLIEALLLIGYLIDTQTMPATRRLPAVRRLPRHSTSPS